jgi:hypothetical protein
MPHGLDTRHRTAARAAGIKAPYPGVDTLPLSGPAAGRTVEADASEERLAPVVHLGDRAARPARDGATRESYAPRIDAQNRINLGKALSALGWTPDTFLVATRENGHIVVRAAADSPLLTPRCPSTPSGASPCRRPSWAPSTSAPATRSSPGSSSTPLNCTCSPRPTRSSC